MRLQLDKKAFFSHLKARGFTHLFHANTVETGLSYFSINSLGSRKLIGDLKLPQSNQFTDETDNKYGIWNDLFFNFHDHHRRFNRPNAFGPLAFRIPLGTLENVLLNSEATISVCKKNAEKWSDADSPTDRWTSGIPDLNDLFKEPVKRGRKSGFFKNGLFPDIVIGNLGALSLNLVDEVQVENNPAWSTHFDELQRTIAATWPKIYSRPEIIVQRTGCPSNCSCGELKTYDQKLQNGFSFGQWQSAHPKPLASTSKKP